MELELFVQKEGWQSTCFGFEQVIRGFRSSWRFFQLVSFSSVEVVFVQFCCREEVERLQKFFGFGRFRCQCRLVELRQFVRRQRYDFVAEGIQLLVRLLSRSFVFWELCVSEGVQYFLSVCSLLRFCVGFYVESKLSKAELLFLGLRSCG